MAGMMKTVTPIGELAEKMVWPGLVRFIGVSQLAAALGLILPAAYHLMRGELQALPINFVLGALAAFVAWGRWRRAAIPPR